MNNQNTDPKYLTIILTVNPPVRIESAKWPIIASAKRDLDHLFGDVDHWSLLVRRHEDCRAIVYGQRQWKQSENAQEYSSSHAGELLPRPASLEEQAHQIARKIQEVGEYLGFPDHFIQECIASMAPEDLD